ncbi:multiple antibiotic resistance regulatory protein MarB [Escherichia coli]|nr:multiple antibiotic resistance regulatory protein MarB [Escherichia coli]
MKPLLSGKLQLRLFSSCVAEQTTQQAVTSSMSWLSSSHEQPPFDLNHMGIGRMLSDALGVPYYNHHAKSLFWPRHIGAY